MLLKFPLNTVGNILEYFFGSIFEKVYIYLFIYFLYPLHFFFFLLHTYSPLACYMMFAKHF